MLGRYYIYTWMNGCKFYVRRRRNCADVLFTQDLQDARLYVRESHAFRFAREIYKARGVLCFVRYIDNMSQQRQS